MGFIIHNEQEKPDSIPYLNSSNRAFKFGDGVFESIRVIDGKAINIGSHVKRLLSGMQALEIEIPANFCTEFFQKQLQFLIAKNNITAGGRARLSVYRESGGNYLPLSNKAGFILEVHHHDTNKFTLNEKPLRIDVYDEIKKPFNKISAFKTSSSLLYIMATLFAQKENLDDVLLINDKGNIIEASASNVFIVSNGVLYTPPIQEGCVGGIMRMFLINTAIANGIKVYECNLTPQNFLAADEILLTNAIKGIQWVGSYRSKRYFNDVAKKLTHLVNEAATSVLV